MKKVVLIVCLNLAFFVSFDQRVISNMLVNEVDDYDITNLPAVKAGYFLLDSYTGKDSVFDKKKSVHFAQQKFDSSGGRMELVKGDNLSLNQVSFTVTYKKLSDTVYESVTRYPNSSKAIPGDFFIDTVINNKATRLCLFSNDKDGAVHVRSVYYVKDPSRLKIMRFDSKNNLKLVYYPYLKLPPSKERRDSTLNDLGKIVFVHRTYEGIEQVGMDTYDKNNRIVASSYVDKDTETQGEVGNRVSYAYNQQGNVIMKITTGLDGELFSEEKSYYKGSVLVRYTRDRDISDEDVNEEYLYDEKGLLKVYRYKDSNPTNETVWRFHRNPTGVPEREDLFKNGQYQHSKFYQYR